MAENTTVPQYFHTEHYINITDGLEFLEPLIQKCAPTEPGGASHPVPMKVIHIPSAWLGAQKYDLLFLTLDTDFLFHLALGDLCIVYDCGVTMKEKDHSAEPENQKCPSRAQWAGLKIIEYVLNRLWFRSVPERILVKDLNVKRFFDEIYSKHLSEETFTKLRYFQRFIPPGVSAVRVDYRSMPAQHDGDYQWYAAIARVCL